MRANFAVVPETTSAPIPSGFELLKEEFLTAEAVAQLTGKTIRTIKSWREKKSGPPFVKVGKTTFYRKAALLACC